VGSDRGERERERERERKKKPDTRRKIETERRESWRVREGESL